jgi:phosphoserine aminotransferase
VQALVDPSRRLLGTSHRQPPVRSLVRSVREGIGELLSLPEGYEVVLGNGGSTVFWDVATFGLIEDRSQHLVHGEFSSKFAAAVAAAPHLGEPEVIESAPGSHAEAKPSEGVDAYALTHNETSTGVAMAIERPVGADPGALVLVDATSAAGRPAGRPGGVRRLLLRPAEGAGQRRWPVAGGVLACRRRADRAHRGSGRWIPTSLDLATALDNSRKDQTYNTPASPPSSCSTSSCAGSTPTAASSGRRPGARSRPPRSTAGPRRGRGRRRSSATPPCAAPWWAPIDLDESIPALTVSQVLRANGVLDTDAYRKLGRNQIRIGMFPAVDPTDVAALTACVDHIVDRL